MRDLPRRVNGHESTLIDLESQNKKNDAHLVDALQKVTDVKNSRTTLKEVIALKQGYMKRLGKHHRRRLAFNPSRFIFKSESESTLNADYIVKISLCALSSQRRMLFCLLASAPIIRGVH